MLSTMAHVAQEAGVSMTTVSHFLNGTRPVSEKTAERIRMAIELTGYRPHHAARALAGARSRSLGLALSGISNPYFMDVVAGVEAEASARGHSVLLVDTHDEPHRELQMARELVVRSVDGLLLAPSAAAEHHALRFLTEEEVPFVLLDRFLPISCDQVGAENVEPTAMLVDHLVELGHRRIGFVAGLEGLSTTTERIAGYRAGLLRNDLPVSQGLIAYGAAAHETARFVTHQLLDTSKPPTALISANNSTTIGVLHALRERGLRIPRDIALVAYDDFEWSDFFEPRLTVIAQPTREIGTAAADLLLQRIDDPQREPQTVRLESKLIHRNSCGCPG